MTKDNYLKFEQLLKQYQSKRNFIYNKIISGNYSPNDIIKLNAKYQMYCMFVNDIENKLKILTLF